MLDYPLDQASALFSHLKWTPLPEALIFNDLVLLFKCINGMSPTYLSNRIKVFEEIDSEIGDDQVTANHRPKLPYTEATLFEIWRCGPVGPIGDFTLFLPAFG